MNKTLESLYTALADDNSDAANKAYDAARRAKVAEIAETIRRDLKSPGAAESIAEQLMGSAESFGRISGDTISAEVPSRYTTSGNPIPLLV